MDPHLLLNLLASAGLVVALMTATCLLAMRTGVHAIVDTVWGLGFVAIAALSFALSLGQGADRVRILLLCMTVIWGCRLATYLYVRNHGKGEDPRYAALLRRHSGPMLPIALSRIYGPQAAVMWVVSLPVQVGMHQQHALGPVVVPGVLLWAIGVVFESVGDAQLARFKRVPENAGRVMDRGLWAWTRHPNYFGDSCVWWGIWLVASGTLAGALSIVSPLLMTHLLVSRSGKALLERRMSRDRGLEYAHYLGSTSGFLPRPPRARSKPVGPG